MNIDTLEKLNYYGLKELVKEYCVSGLGKNLIDKLTPSTSIKQVERMLNETTEARNLLDASYHMPLEGIFNIAPFIDKMDKGGTLEPSELTMMSDFLRGCRKIKQFIKDKEGYAPTLAYYALNITELEDIEEEINRAIRGSIIDSNASKDLKKIRRNIENCEGEIKERLDKFLKNSKNKEAIQDFFVSKRNGKYTVPIKPAYKNQVSGSIIETSSRGTTLFVEPSVISKYSSKLEILKVEESIEEYKILAGITEMIFVNVKELKMNMEIISEYDMIMAKGKYSVSIGGIKPKVNEHGFIKIIKGKYPLIKDAVSLDFEIGKDYRTLIVTGPNAGGKTIVLKTIGLLTLAVQSGFHIQGKVDTEISIFNKVFVDIGDNQSVENALSTFSSHVKNLAEILKESNKSTLLLFDEIGSGTEPNEGAALAIAILEEFYQRGAITIASTHYGEIKNFSENHPDFENAAMEFKKDTLDPLYKLKIGKAGDSNALYISKKMGVPENILNRTKEYIENKSYNYKIINESKIRKEKKKEIEILNEYKIGDKVLLLDKNESGIVYKEIDNYNNVTIFYNNEFIEINYKRLKLEIKAGELYPEGYDLNQIFTSFNERKLEHDIERGSKKALRKIKKDMKEK